MFWAFSTLVSNIMVCMSVTTRLFTILRRQVG